VGRNLLYSEDDSNRSAGTIRAGVSIGKRFWTNLNLNYNLINTIFFNFI
jgi:hypothetical protein